MLSHMCEYITLIKRQRGMRLIHLLYYMNFYRKKADHSRGTSTMLDYYGSANTLSYSQIAGLQDIMLATYPHV